MTKREKQIQDELREIAKLWYLIYPFTSVHELAKNKWIAVVHITPTQPLYIVGTEYKTELEAEFYAKRYIREKGLS